MQPDARNAAAPGVGTEGGAEIEGNRSGASLLGSHKVCPIACSPSNCYCPPHPRFPVPIRPYVLSSTATLHKPARPGSPFSECGLVRYGLPVLVHDDDVGNRRLCGTCFAQEKAGWLL